MSISKAHTHSGLITPTKKTKLYGKDINTTSYLIVKKAVTKWIKSFLTEIILRTRRGHALIFNILFHHNLVFKAIGFINHLTHFLETVFVVYPAKPWYAWAYVHEKRWPIMKWKPWLVSIYKPKKGKFSLKFVVSCNERDLDTSENIKNMESLVLETERIRKLVACKDKLFAGTMPSRFKSRGLISETPELQTTVEIVEEVVEEVRKELNYPNNTPVVILGGGGLVGSDLFKQTNNRRIIRLDTKFNGNQKIPSDIQNKKFILINVSTRQAIKKYFNQLSSQTVIINEVYPPPSKEDLAILSKLSIRVAHIAGNRGWSLLRFPGPYKKAIPCCGVYKKTYVVYQWLN